ncbi:MAG: DnaJ domain-containing protein [Phycisphaeraceae bacterium]|nr:DnaJ domain-containing protein [Phycisphaeraceae bacterium]
MAEFQDYYGTLGVARSASAEEIQRAFRKLAREYHPDVNKSPEAEKRFKALNEAYEVLKDPQKRKLYDQLGNDWKAGQDFRPPPGWRGTSQPGQSAGFEGTGDFSDFFESLFGRGGPFAQAGARSGGMGGGGMGGGGGFGGMGFDFDDLRAAGGAATRHARTQRAPRRGRTIEAEIAIPLSDAYHGGTRQISLADPNKPSEARRIDVRIPPGVTDGSIIRLAGQGGQGESPSHAGDLLLTIRIQPDPRFRIEPETLNLITSLPLAPWEAALGAKRPVQTPDQEVIITIPPGSQGGQRLRIKNKGLPRRSGDRADLLVELRIVIPKQLSDEERRLFEELAKVSNFDARSA